MYRRRKLPGRHCHSAHVRSRTEHEINPAQYADERQAGADDPPVTAEEFLCYRDSGHSTVSGSRSHDTVIVEMDASELPVAVFVRQRDRVAGFESRTAHFRERVLESVWQIDARPVLIAGDGIANRNA